MATDQDVRNALDTIVRHSLEHTVANHGIHHIHPDSYCELTRDQRKRAAELLLELAADLVLQAEPDDPTGRYPLWYDDILAAQLELRGP